MEASNPSTRRPSRLRPLRARDLALATGGDGTGKTLAAEVLANDLGR